MPKATGEGGRTAEEIVMSTKKKRGTQEEPGLGKLTKNEKNGEPLSTTTSEGSQDEK
jgi:hypothetical protein